MQPAAHAAPTDLYDGHLLVQLPWCRVLEAPLLPVPARAFQHQAVDVAAQGGGLRHLVKQQGREGTGGLGLKAKS